jgi:hypothetical protein
VLAVARVLQATLAASTTTPDTVALTVLRELTATLAAVSTTPDATLAVVREFLATLAAATTTPDDVDLTISIGGDRFLAAVLAAATTTPTIPWGLARGGGGPVGLAIQRPDSPALNFGSFGAVAMYQTRILDIAAPAARYWYDPFAESLCIWAAYLPRGADDLADSYIDESGEGHNTGVGVAPTWDAVNGWKFNGSTQYLTTTFVPQSDQTQTVIVQFSNVTNQGYLVGLWGGTNKVFAILPNDFGIRAIYQNGGYFFLAPHLLSGNVAVAGNRGYRNGSQESGYIGAWAGSTSLAINIGAAAVDYGEGVDVYMAVHVKALAIYDCILTATQVRGIAMEMRCAGNDYLLRANFNADDQSFVDGQVLDTVAEGVQDGSLTVKKTNAGAVVEVLSNELKLIGASPLGWGDLGLYDTDVVTKTIGSTLLCQIQRVGPGMLAWHDANTLAGSSASTEYSFYFTTTGDIRVYTDTGWSTTTLVAAGLTYSTWYEFALVLGGHDSSEIPWFSGAGGTYNYGCGLYIKGGAYTTWTLLWRFLRGVDNVYPQIQQYESTGRTCFFDNLRVPDADLSAVLQPTCFSTFDAANGTSLDAITPEVGGAWTEQAGDLEILSNKCVANTYASNQVLATVAAGVADVLCDAVLNTGDGGTTAGYLVLRYTDTTHFWLAGKTSLGSETVIYEKNGGSLTKRASAASPWVDSTDYDIRAIAYGQTIDGFVDGGTKISYASAALNETATVHGVRLFENTPNVAPTFDNFAVYPRTSSAYENELDSH